MATNQELVIVRGDDKSWILTFTDDAGTPINLTGSSVFFTVKLNQRDPDSSALIQKEVTSHTSPTTGVTTVTITNTDTNLEARDYYYDFQYVTSGGTVTTILYGKFSVVQDITLDS